MLHENHINALSRKNDWLDSYFHRPVLKHILYFGGVLFLMIPDTWHKIFEWKPPSNPPLVERNMTSKHV